MTSVGEAMFNAAKATLSDQGATLDGLRTRAGTLMTANSIVAAFLGGRALDQKDALQEWQTKAGIGTFVVSVALVMIVLLPLFEWHFGMSAETVKKTVGIEPDDELSGTGHQQLADKLTTYVEKNKTKLDGLMWVMIAATVALFAASCFWLLAIEAS